MARATSAVRGRVEALADGRCRVEMGADSAEWLAFVVAELALDHEIEVDAPPEVLDVLRRLSDRVTRVL